eukprot:gene189-348_t
MVSIVKFSIGWIVSQSEGIVAVRDGAPGHLQSPPVFVDVEHLKTQLAQYRTRAQHFLASSEPNVQNKILVTRSNGDIISLSKEFKWSASEIREYVVRSEQMAAQIVDILNTAANTFTQLTPSNTIESAMILNEINQEISQLRRLRQGLLDVADFGQATIITLIPLEVAVGLAHGGSDTVSNYFHWFTDPRRLASQIQANLKMARDGSEGRGFLYHFQKLSALCISAQRKLSELPPSEHLLDDSRLDVSSGLSASAVTLAHLAWVSRFNTVLQEGHELVAKMRRAFVFLS